MARRLIANITIGHDYYGPDYAPLPDDLWGEVRNPAVWVDDDATEPAIDGSDASGEPEGWGEKKIDDHTRDELRAYAEAHGIDVPAGARKAELIEAIEAHLPPAPGE